MADVERRLSDGSARYPAFRLVRDGGQVARTEYSSDLPWRPDSFPGVADPARIAALFERGATIVLQALHHNWLPLAHFCRELERELEHPAQANAYYTPRRAQGFAVHHDTHDVFVLQVAGEKHWRVYQPLLELPLKDQRYTAALGAHGSPVLELTLRAGDTLYLPRGWLHDALTSDSDSLHITVGLNVYTWLDAFRDAVEQLASDVELRRSVPDDGEGAAALLSHLRAQLMPDEVTRRKRRRFIRSRRPILNGQLAEVRGLTDVTVDTLVERRPTVIAELDGATLAFEGKELTFPDRVASELHAIMAYEEPFSAAELSSPLDDEGRLVLVRRLIREGFLRRSAADA